MRISDWSSDVCSSDLLAMHLDENARLLRIYLGESDRDDGKPLYESLILKAREMHLAGATALRGPLGYGKSSRLHTTKILRLSADLPIIIEIVDVEDRIKAFLAAVDRKSTRLNSSHQC